MPAPFDFPGHYWDEARGKFFKIEATSTAPQGATWSQNYVAFQQSQQRSADERQRRHERSEASSASHGRAAKRRDRRGRHRPGQHPDQQSDAIYSFLAAQNAKDEGDGEEEEEEEPAYVSKSRRVYTRRPLLAHEMAFGGLPSSATVSDGRIFGQPRATIAASTYGRELEFKGAVPVLDEDSSMMIDGQLFNPNDRATWATRGTIPGRRMARPFITALGRPSILSNTKITAMYVHSEEQPPGMGIVYTNYYRGALDAIKGQYVMADEDENVMSTWPTRSPFGKYTAHERTCPEDIMARDITAICFHETSQNLIVASRNPNSNEPEIPVLQFFKPDIRDATSFADDVTWQLGPDNFPSGRVPTQLVPSGTHKPIFKVFGRRASDSVLACAPAPQGYDALCLVGTVGGLRAIDLETVTRLTDVNVRYFQPPLANSLEVDDIDNDDARRFMNDGGLRNLAPTGLYMHRQKRMGLLPSVDQEQDVLPNQPNLVTTVDFVNNHPRLAVAGGRNPVPWLVDLRDRSWHPFGANTNATGGKSNAVAHVRSVGEYHVVAAGLLDSMVMYDLRYLKAPRAIGAGSLFGRPFGSQKASKKVLAAEPLFRFTGYYNHSRISGLGFDVDPSLGIVAAAEHHKETSMKFQGGMALFSLQTGERLHTPGLWRVHHIKERLERHYTPTPEMLLSRYYNFTVYPGQEDPAGFLDSRQDRAVPFTVVENGNDKDLDKGSWGNYRWQERPEIAALRLSTLPHEGTSLFVGVGARVHKYSIRRNREDIFYGEDEEDER